MAYKPNRHENCVDEWMKVMKTDRQRLDWLEAQSGAQLISCGTDWKLILKNGTTYRENTLRELFISAMEGKTNERH